MAEDDEDPDPTIANLYPQFGEILEGKYEIQEVLGSGAMGCVIRAQHTLRKVPVALKFMSPAIMGMKDVVERFYNEGVAASKIDSEHIVKVFDVSKLPSGVPYMVMEYLKGEDLYRLMRREGKPYLHDTARAIHFTLQILRGLQAAHHVKIVHRDMKPANCFITGKDGDRDFIKLVDFGISKIRPDDSASGLELTHAGAALGTPLYMSLEQARSPKDVDARTDLYSASVILYEMLGGVTPFIPESGTLSELFTMLALEEAKPLDSLRTGLPAGLSDVVSKGLHKDRDRRYQTAELMAEALMPYADERSDYVASRLLRTLSNPARSQRPPPGSSVAPPRITGTLMMSQTAPATLPRTHGGPDTEKQSPPTGAIGATGVETAPGTAQGTIQGLTRTMPEARSTPLVWAIAVVAVAAVAGAAWALGKVSTPAAPDTTVVALPPPPPTQTAVSSAAPDPFERPTFTSLASSSGTVARSSSVTRSSGSAAPPPSASATSSSRQKLNQVKLGE